MRTPSCVIEHACEAEEHIGSASDPAQNGTHVPVMLSRSTWKHIDVMSQSSTPPTGDPSTVHGSPGPPGSSAIGLHRVAFQCIPPSFAHGKHFSPFIHV